MRLYINSYEQIEIVLRNRTSTSKFGRDERKLGATWKWLKFRSLHLFDSSDDNTLNWSIG